jgi:phenylacetate-CoA ligase
LRFEKGVISELKIIQEERLSRLLNHAANNVPFYKEKVSKRNGISLLDFPILTKSDIKKHFYSIMTSDLRSQYSPKQGRGKGYSWLVVKTGGSTGEPTIVVHDREYRDRAKAGLLYATHLCGFPLGTPYFFLWGNMQEISHIKESPAQRLRSFLANETVLNAFKMGNEDIEKYINIINSSSAQHMKAYADAAYQLARYARMHGKKVRFLKSIMACAGTVTQDLRETLEDVFQAKVHNKYGSRDCAEMACECDRGGIHILANNVIIEVVDVKGNPLPFGQTGRILVTLLSNYSFPIIRYEIGDEGALSADSCPCGRPFPLLDRIEGRSIEFLTNDDGGFVSPVYIRHIVGVIHNPGWIRRFQFIQNSLTTYELYLEAEPQTTEIQFKDTESLLKKDLKAVLGDRSDIRLIRVEEIQPTASGKFLYTINKTSI